MNRSKSPPRRARRFSRAAVVVGLTVSTVAGMLTFSQGTASAQTANIPGCGTFEFDPVILWMYGANGGPSGQLGCPTSHTSLTPDWVGVHHQFQRGAIYWKLSVSGTQPFIVLDPIRAKWGSMDWERSFLGWPVTNTNPVFGPNGELGVYNHFEGGSIISSSAGTFEVHGAIRDKFFELGLETVGFPTSDELDFPEGGKASHFTKAGIYWWPDTGPIFLKDDTVVVNYSGLLCEEEMDWDQFSDSDEPYVTIAAISSRPSADGTMLEPVTRTVQSSVYDDVDRQEARAETIELYRGPPVGLVLDSTVREWDFGNPNHFRTEVDVGVFIATSAVFAGAVIVTGTSAPLVAAPLYGVVAPAVGDAVNDALDTADDTIGTNARTFTARDMVLLAFANQVSWKGVTYTLFDGPFTGGGSKYDVALSFRTT